MSRVAWDLIKNSKHFYVDTYRKAITFLLFSTVLNVFLGMGIYYAYFNLPEPDFYATSGVTPPVMLTSLDEPNYTSVPLLASEAGSNNNKVMPN
ncbi:type IVB secretion system protein IcmM/DotJ [Legionella nagasakiensis]|uniref:type IVB secretion system protein IcmM/DotJ n=1 Tax=Legionella nagasakiensis TaxID=535290 RepID=UPI0010544E76|nr:type IVB secretion system protein IcmM/DotJ [Legionella nagasakiensis]